MKVIITPIGTSLITNYIDKLGDNEDVKEIYNDIKDKENIEESDLEDIKGDLKEYLENYSNSCAERTSIDKIKEKINEEVKIIFIASDTQISKFLTEIFKDFYSNSEIKVIDGLQTDNKDKFEKEGLKNFIEFFKEKREEIKDNIKRKLEEEYKNRNNRDDISKSAEKKIKDKTKKILNEAIIFNITAGYKAFIPYLTIIGQLYNIPIKYIFEDSDKLISIPQLPIGFDDKIADLYLPYLDNYILGNINIPEKIKNDLENYGFIKENRLTLFGEIFKNYMNHKTSSLGDLIEYLLLGIYIKDKDSSLEKSKNYTVNGQKGDIDLIIKKENSIEFIEVKSFGQFKKFKNEQLEKYKNYILQEYKKYSSKTITVLFYLLDYNLLNEYKDDFQKIKEILSKDKIDFQVKHIEIKPENFINFIREFDKKQIKDY